jgi:hypothetical protein
VYFSVIILTIKIYFAEHGANLKFYLYLRKAKEITMNVNDVVKLKDGSEWLIFRKNDYKAIKDKTFKALRRAFSGSIDYHLRNTISGTEIIMSDKSMNKNKA